MCLGILLNLQQWGFLSLLFYLCGETHLLARFSLPLPFPPSLRPLAYCFPKFSDLILHKCLIRLQRFNTIRSVAHKLTNPLTLRQRNNSRGEASQVWIRRQLATGTICFKNHTAVHPHTTSIQCVLSTFQRKGAWRQVVSSENFPCLVPLCQFILPKSSHFFTEFITHGINAYLTTIFSNFLPTQEDIQIHRRK